MASESEGNKHQDTFVIRCAKCLEDLQWVVKLASEQGFGPHEKEAECCFSAGLTPYFYIGELNGKRIGCICRVKHGEEVVYGGYEMVAKPYRGQDMDCSYCQPCSHADFEKLFTHGAYMLGTSQVCKLLLAAWLVHPQKSSWVAFDNMKIYSWTLDHD